MSEPRPARQHLSVGRAVGVVVLGALAVGAVLVIAAAAYGIAREYGSPSIPWLGILPWALIPALLAGLATLVLRTGTARAVWSPWLVGVVVLVLVTLVAGGLTAAATSAHDADAAARDSACSEADVAVLSSVPGYSADLGGPLGEDDGSCVILLGSLANADDAVASVVASMVADGWTAGAPVGDGGVQVSRSGVYVVVSARGTDDKGWTDVVVSIPPG